MKKLLVSSAVALAVTGGVSAPVMADTSITGSVRIGGLYQDPDGGDQDLSISNFGSRFIFTTSEDIGNGLTGIGRIEVGINPNTTSGSREFGGFDRTRQVWGGIAGGFGTVKIGAQYTSFYDTVTSKGDIAWWGSCFVEFECSRVPASLKYSGSSGAFSYSTSIEANGGDEDNDELDNWEGGVSFDGGSYKVGAALSVLADDGVLFGLAGSTKIAGISLSGVLQVADDDFAGEADDVTVLTLTGQYAGFYGLVTNVDSDEGSSNFTLGYTFNIADKTLMYFEVQQLDSNGSETTIGRATLKRDFSILGS